MKGVVLAGGPGIRLFPLTKITNKHLLPIYDRPMIYYPIQALVDAGIQEILVVTGGRNSGDFLRRRSNGKQFGLKHINYTYQEDEGSVVFHMDLDMISRLGQFPVARQHAGGEIRSEEHTSELQSLRHLVCRLL